MIAKLLVKSSQQKRQSDEVSSRAAEASEDAADAHRLELMKSKADMTLSAGVAAGLSQCGTGLGSVAGGFAGEASLKANAGSPVAGEIARDATAKLEGGGQLAGGLGKLAEAHYKNAADDFDQQIVGAESSAKRAKRAQDQLNKQIDAGAQHEGKVMQLLQEIEQGQAQCARAALLRMA